MKGKPMPPEKPKGDLKHEYQFIHFKPGETTHRERGGIKWAKVQVGHDQRTHSDAASSSVPLNDPSSHGAPFQAPVSESQGRWSTVRSPIPIAPSGTLPSNGSTGPTSADHSIAEDKLSPGFPMCDLGFPDPLGIMQVADTSSHGGPIFAPTYGAHGPHHLPMRAPNHTPSAEISPSESATPSMTILPTPSTTPLSTPPPLVQMTSEPRHFQPYPGLDVSLNPDTEQPVESSTHVQQSDPTNIGPSAMAVDSLSFRSRVAGPLPPTHPLQPSCDVDQDSLPTSDVWMHPNSSQVEDPFDRDAPLYWDSAIPSENDTDNDTHGHFPGVF